MASRRAAGILACLLFLTACEAGEPSSSGPSSQTPEVTAGRSLSVSELFALLDTSLMELEESKAVPCVFFRTSSGTLPADLRGMKPAFDGMAAIVALNDALAEPPDGWLAVANDVTDANRVVFEMTLLWGTLVLEQEAGRGETASLLIPEFTAYCEQLDPLIREIREGADAIR